jgi:glycosyltransferase involved in cell wall biosynthesis
VDPRRFPITNPDVRILFALAGLHRVNRGAEVAFTAVASALARAGDDVTLIGSGPDRADCPYRFISVPAIDRRTFERWPAFPPFRSETAWEEGTFAPGLLNAYRPSDFDVTLTCSYPFTNWILRRPAFRGRRPPHVFVTQNGDWPAVSNAAEFRLFGCEGLICTNPDYYERNSGRYRAALISNGVDTHRFTPGPAERERLGLAPASRIVLMVSALIPSKNVSEGIRAVSRVPSVTLVVAGDGPMRDELQRLADELLPGRYRRLTVSADDMPALYRSADAFLHLSRDESFGNVFVEAMACGTPIVAWDLPRTRWIVGEEGLLADPSDPDSVAAQLSTAVEMPKSAGGGLVHRAAQFDWSKIAGQYGEFLRRVVQEQRSR